jgi:hypothetical protein
LTLQTSKKAGRKFRTSWTGAQLIDSRQKLRQSRLAIPSAKAKEVQPNRTSQHSCTTFAFAQTHLPASLTIPSQHQFVNCVNYFENIVTD